MKYTWGVFFCCYWNFHFFSASDGVHSRQKLRSGSENNCFKACSFAPMEWCFQSTSQHAFQSWSRRYETCWERRETRFFIETHRRNAHEPDMRGIRMQLMGFGHLAWLWSIWCCVWSRVLQSTWPRVYNSGLGSVSVKFEHAKGNWSLRAAIMWVYWVADCQAYEGCRHHHDSLIKHSWPCHWGHEPHRECLFTQCSGHLNHWEVQRFALLLKNGWVDFLFRT